MCFQTLFNIVYMLLIEYILQSISLWIDISPAGRDCGVATPQESWHATNRPSYAEGHKERYVESFGSLCKLPAQGI